MVKLTMCEVICPKCRCAYDPYDEPYDYVDSDCDGDTLLRNFATTCPKCKANFEFSEVFRYVGIIAKDD